MGRRLAAPDEYSGINPNTPVRLYDTHPNRRIAIGDEVVKIDPEEPNVRGLVLGYCADDRIWVKWPTVVMQEDVHEVMAMKELGNVVSMNEDGTVIRPQSVHTPGAFPKKTASKNGEPRFSFRKVKSGSGYAFDVLVDDRRVGTIRQKIKSGKRYWACENDPKGKLYSTRKEAAEKLCTRKKCGSKYMKLKKANSALRVAAHPSTPGYNPDLEHDPNNPESIWWAPKDVVDSQADTVRNWKDRTEYKDPSFRDDPTSLYEDSSMRGQDVKYGPEGTKIYSSSRKAKQRRIAGVKQLKEIAFYLKGKSRKACKIVTDLYKTASVLHLMDKVPSTKRMASHPNTERVWKTNLNRLLTFTGNLRKANMVSLAGDLELAALDALAYDRHDVRRKANISNPPTAFMMTMGNQAWQAWDQVLKAAQQQGINPMTASYQDVAHLMRQVQRQFQGQHQQLSESQADMRYWQQQQQMGNPQTAPQMSNYQNPDMSSTAYNMWHQQQAQGQPTDVRQQWRTGKRKRKN